MVQFAAVFESEALADALFQLASFNSGDMVCACIIWMVKGYEEAFVCQQQGEIKYQRLIFINADYLIIPAAQHCHSKRGIFFTDSHLRIMDPPPLALAESLGNESVQREARSDCCICVNLFCDEELADLSPGTRADLLSLFDAGLNECVYLLMLGETGVNVVTRLYVLHLCRPRIMAILEHRR